MTATLEDIRDILNTIKDDVRDLIALQRISPDQIAISEGLSDISKRLGLVQAGEFRSGNGQDPGKGFSGVRIGYPAFVYNGEQWNIVGIENDELQVGIRASDGKLVAGAGGVILSSTGIVIENNLVDGISFLDTSGDTTMFVWGNNSDALSLGNLGVGGNGGINLTVLLTDSSSPYLELKEDPVQAGRFLALIEDGTFGSRLTLGHSALIDLRSEGSSGGSTFIRMRETAETPPSLSASTDAFHLYMKDNKLIIQSNDGGTHRYKYLDLTGTSATWTHTTTPP